MKKYTAILLAYDGDFDDSTVIARRFSTKDAETPKDALKRLKVSGMAFFIYKGWPKNILK